MFKRQNSVLKNWQADRGPLAAGGGLPGYNRHNGWSSPGLAPALECSNGWPVFLI